MSKHPLSRGLAQFVLNCDRSTVKHALQNTQNDCYQWLSNSSRVHQIRFWLGSAPDPAGGAYSAPPDSLAGLRGPTSKGRGQKGTGKERGTGNGGNGMEGKGLDARESGGRGVEGRKKERRGGRGGKKNNTPSVNSCLRPCRVALCTCSGS